MYKKDSKKISSRNGIFLPGVQKNTESGDCGPDSNYEGNPSKLNNTNNMNNTSNDEKFLSIFDKRLKTPTSKKTSQLKKEKSRLNSNKKKTTFIPISSEKFHKEKKDDFKQKVPCVYTIDQILEYKKIFTEKPKSLTLYEIRYPCIFGPNKTDISNGYSGYRGHKHKYDSSHNQHHNSSYNPHNNSNGYKKDKDKSKEHWPRAHIHVLTIGENAWRPDCDSKKVKSDENKDIKTIKGILNKLSPENHEIMIEETKKLHYSDPNVIDIIFNKAVSEPFYSDLYAKYCEKLQDLHILLIEMCETQFKLKKHKNLCQFIGELYKRSLIYKQDLLKFVSSLEEDLNENNLEILCTLIITVGANKNSDK